MDSIILVIMILIIGHAVPCIRHFLNAQHTQQVVIAVVMVGGVAVDTVKGVQALQH